MLATIALFALMIYLISRVVILTMNVSDAGVKFIRRWEGSRSAAYHDSAGLLTVGVGHLLTRDELSSGKVEIGAEYVKWRDGLSDEQIDLLLRQDLLRPVTAGLLGSIAVFYPQQLSTYAWKAALVTGGMLLGLWAWKLLIAPHLPSTDSMGVENRLRMLLARAVFIGACIIGMCWGG